MGVLDAIDRAASADQSAVTRKVKVILGADLDAEWRRLSSSLDSAARQDERDGSLANPFPNTTKAVEEMEARRAEIEASQVTFEFEPLGWVARMNLQAEHPPRDENLLDLTKGYNTETFIPALIRAAFVKVTDAEGDEKTTLSETRWTSLLGPVKAGRPVLTYVQVMDLFLGADELNVERIRVPMSARFLVESQDSEASSTPSGPGKARPRSGSTAGSRRGSPRSSTTAKKTASSSRGSRSGS